MTAADVPLGEAGEILVAEAGRFASYGWMRGASGNLSVVVSREPLRLALTASGVDKDDLTVADIVVIGADGRALGHPASRTLSSDAPAKASAEGVLHARIARVTGAGAVVHVHTVASVVASRRWPGGVELADLEMLKGIGVRASGEKATIPVVPNSQDMGTLADRLEAARDPRIPAVIVADHGLFVWGSGPLQARRHTEVVHWLLEVAVALP